jgi:hypothetical protein
MNIIGFQDIAIDDLALPSNWEAILAEAETQDIAESVARIGIIHEPVVRSEHIGAGGMVLIAGRHRVAACVKRGATEVFCKVIECTDLEAELLTREENAQRWHNPQKRKEILLDLRGFYTKLFEKRPELAPQVPDRGKGTKGGRPKTAQGKADLVIAKLTGTSPRSGRVRNWREHRAEVVKATIAGPLPPVKDSDWLVPPANTAIPTPPPVPIETFGLAVGDDFLAGVTAIRAHMMKAHDLAAAAQGQLTQLEKLDLYPKGRLDRLRSALHDATAMLGDAIPVSLCGFCKGLPGAVETCAACLSCSIMGTADLGRVPQELRATKDPVVRINGKLVAVQDLLGDPFGEAV